MGQQRVRGIERRTDPPLDVGPCSGLPSDDFRQPSSLCSRQAVLEVLAVAGIREARRDIVEQHCETPDSRIIETLRLGQQNANRLFGVKRESFAGMKAI